MPVNVMHATSIVGHWFRMFLIVDRLHFKKVVASNFGARGPCALGKTTSFVYWKTLDNATFLQGNDNSYLES